MPWTSNMECQVFINSFSLFQMCSKQFDGLASVSRLYTWSVLPVQIQPSTVIATVFAVLPNSCLLLLRIMPSSCCKFWALWFHFFLAVCLHWAFINYVCTELSFAADIWNSPFLGYFSLNETSCLVLEFCTTERLIFQNTFCSSQCSNYPTLCITVCNMLIFLTQPYPMESWLSRGRGFSSAGHQPRKAVLQQDATFWTVAAAMLQQKQWGKGTEARPAVLRGPTRGLELPVANVASG